MKNRFQIFLVVLALLSLAFTGANAQLAGGTYTIGVDYSTMAAAIAAINSAGVSGPVVFNVPAGYTETFTTASAGSIYISSNVPTATNTITFQKSGTGTNPLITAAASVGTGSSDFIFRIYGTSYLTFDGIDVQENSSNTTAAYMMEYGFTIQALAAAGAQYNTIKNCTITLNKTNTNKTYGIAQANSITTGSITNSYNTYKNIIINNAFYGMNIGGNSTYSDVGCVIEGCTISNIGGGSFAGHTYGIYSQYQNGLTIDGNEISSVTNAASAIYSVYGIEALNMFGTTNIYNNKVHDITNNNTATSTSGYAKGIDVGVGSVTDIVNVYNNIVYAINLNVNPGSTASASTRLIGIQTNGVGVSGTPAGYYNFYYNSIYLTNSTGSYYYSNANLYLSAYPVSVTVKNNIFKNSYSYTATIASVCLVLNNGTLTASDYNNFDCATSGTNYTAKVGTSYQTLTTYQAGTTYEVHSHQFTTDFISTTAGSENLHLNLSSVNTNYIGTPISGITTDIDGDTRNATYPYIGADENVTYVLPVELVSFTAAGTHNGAVLAWKTATEKNNYGFNIERRTVGSSVWSKVGFVAGHGTSNIANSYSYADANVAAGTYAYRVTQVDNDGTMKTYNESQVTVGAAAKALTLGNYPNPFNPTTTFEFSVPNDGLTTVKIYNVLGQELVTAFSGEVKAGTYQHATFDGSKFSSGVYFYSIENNGQRMVKKMLMMK